MQGNGAGKSKGDKASKNQSRSFKAGLQFPVGRIHRLLKRGNYALRVGAGAPVYLAVLAGNAAHNNKKRRIMPRHIQLTIRNDEELNKLLDSVVISQGGVVPHIDPALPALTKMKKNKDENFE
ncbi:histone H2A [Mycena olivaceomarginata]|nr:histone H2A [Mycena olivaceomarginata]